MTCQDSALVIPPHFDLGDKELYTRAKEEPGKKKVFLTDLLEQTPYKWSSIARKSDV